MIGTSVKTLEFATLPSFRILPCLALKASVVDVDVNVLLTVTCVLVSVELNTPLVIERLVPTLTPPRIVDDAVGNEYVDALRTPEVTDNPEPIVLNGLFWIYSGSVVVVCVQSALAPDASWVSIT